MEDQFKDAYKSMHEKYPSLLLSQAKPKNWLDQYTSTFEFNSTFQYSSAFNYDSGDNCAPDMNSEWKNTYKSAFQYTEIPQTEETTLDGKEEWTSYSMRLLLSFASYLLVIMTLPFSLFFCLKTVPSLQRVVILRLGKLQHVKGPGLILVLPCLDKWFQVDLKPRCFSIPPQQVLTTDTGIVEMGADIHCQVVNAIHCVLRISSLDQTLKQLGKRCLINFASQRAQEQLESDRELLQEDIKNDLNKNTVRWGLEVTKIEFNSFRILKVAEPVNAVTKLLSAVKTTLEPMATAMAAGSTSADASNNETADINVKAMKQAKNMEDFIKKLESITENQPKKKMSQESVVFELEIVGDETTSILCRYAEGACNAIIGTDHGLTPEVKIQVTTEVMEGLVQGKMTPLSAYMGGKLKVEGNIKLLKELEGVLKGIVA